MSANFFVDSNIAIYALDTDSAKGQIATRLLRDRPSLSTQVIMETVNVLIRKLAFTKHDALEHAKFLLFNSDTTVILRSTLLRAFDIAERYEYSHWDSLIIASAIESGCTILYSEDLRDGQIIEGSLTIRNPFLKQI